MSNTSAILSAAVGGSAFPTSLYRPLPPPSTDRYRYYQCTYTPDVVVCKQVPEKILKGEHENGTQIHSIDSWVPTLIDKPILHWRMMDTRPIVFE